MKVIIWYNTTIQPGPSDDDNGDDNDNDNEDDDADADNDDADADADGDDDADAILTQERTNLANGGVQGPVNQSGYLISLFLTYLKALSSNLISKLLKMKKKNIIDPGIMKQLRKAGWSSYCGGYFLLIQPI